MENREKKPREPEAIWTLSWTEIVKDRRKCQCRGANAKAPTPSPRMQAPLGELSWYQQCAALQIGW